MQVDDDVSSFFSILLILECYEKSFILEKLIVSFNTAFISVSKPNQQQKLTKSESYCVWFENKFEVYFNFQVTYSGNNVPCFNPDFSVFKISSTSKLYME